MRSFNVLAHVSDLNGFVEGISILLGENGQAVIEVPYLLDLADHCEFDTIYHQHLCYFSVTSLDRLFARHGPIGSCGKTSRIPFLEGMRLVSDSYFGRLGNAGIFAYGACWTSDILDSPTNQDSGCSWSEIVENCVVHQRYFLSRKALLGIARRARRPRLFSQQEGQWLSTTERHAFWTMAARE